MSWFPRKKVLVPYDFSDPAQRAVSVARELVADPGDLHLAHVIELAADYDPNVFTADIAYEQRREYAVEKLHEAAAQAGVSKEQATVLQDFGQRGAGVTLAKYASEIGAELIVMPTHGYTGLKRLLLGSVAEQVVRHAECPVLLLPLHAMEGLEANSD